ncbi:hypothetical protein BGX29_011618 [Mortierella sp. GBA35]|nr:hypothetical protein BGX29_011618 [Mortierella sp. GBA35]KAF9092882.1 hypothetical protein BGX23_003862 [Mortierella sp. AD031]
MTITTRLLSQLRTATPPRLTSVASVSTTSRRLYTTVRKPASPVDKRTIVVSGPSGGGKSTLLDRLFREYPSTFSFSVSHTTRKPRPGEKDGISYHFVSQAVIDDLIARDQFLEYAVFSGNTYGTSRQTVEDISESGKICIMDVELQGVKQLREIERKEKHGFAARYVLVRPRSLDTLEARLRARGTETEEAIERRMETATREWEYGMDRAFYDHIVVNDELDVAYGDLCQFIFNE